MLIQQSAPSSSIFISSSSSFWKFLSALPRRDPGASLTAGPLKPAGTGAWDRELLKYNQTRLEPEVFIIWSRDIHATTTTQPRHRRLLNMNHLFLIIIHLLQLTFYETAAQGCLDWAWHRENVLGSDLALCFFGRFMLTVPVSLNVLVEQCVRTSR